MPEAEPETIQIALPEPGQRAILVLSNNSRVQFDFDRSAVDYQTLAGPNLILKLDNGGEIILIGYGRYVDGVSHEMDDRLDEWAHRELSPETTPEDEDRNEERRDEVEEPPTSSHGRPATPDLALNGTEGGFAASFGGDGTGTDLAGAAGRLETAPNAPDMDGDDRTFRPGSDGHLENIIAGRNSTENDESGGRENGSIDGSLPGDILVPVPSEPQPPEDGGNIDPKGREPNTITGTDHGEALVGTLGNDEISGLGGDDFILGGGGNDIILAGAGNDLIALDKIQDSFVDAGEDLDRIDGGEGFDTLMLGGVGEAANLNATILDDAAISSIEHIDLRGLDGDDVQEMNGLMLQISDVLDITAGADAIVTDDGETLDNALLVSGDSLDVLFTGNSFVQDPSKSTKSIDGNIYDVYLPIDGKSIVTLLVDQDIGSVS